MTRQETKLALAQLFREAGSEHHREFIAVNGHDPEWQQWYAAWLAPRMEVLLGRSLDVPLLAQQLRAAEDQRLSLHPLPDWPLFYANYFLLSE